MRTLFVVAVTVSPAVLSDALAQQLNHAAEPLDGLHLFLSTGCGACHRIAGTEAQGKIGPDLTHLASRETIGANLLPMTRANLADWIRHTQELKPGARMPSFGMLPVSETNAIVGYLVTLK
ncbi:c-type cytochrome [Aquicoccus sp. G2-2]|uniref:c-type cytochrome n=1 Tax=Aquicoccus sp. G2-2 TaxID=3092120 RepID=UPI002ADF6D5F|nr:c-type cytochrome [Aquicoccus sp. G2-2]MEA1115283.1 c-type cytochrome [Aquicoccus sp. G2-2]